MKHNDENPDVPSLLVAAREEIKGLKISLGAGGLDAHKLRIENETFRTQLATAQADVTRLTSERDAARTSLAAAQGQTTVLTTERDAARTQLTTVTGERDIAKGEVASLTASQADFDKRVRMDLIKFGISPTSITLPKPDPTTSMRDENGKLNLDAICLAARAAAGQ